MTFWVWRAANATLFDTGAFDLPLNEGADRYAVR
jgi:hypothetical protein